jgi:hypothetical protein
LKEFYFPRAPLAEYSIKICRSSEPTGGGLTNQPVPLQTAAAGTFSTNKSRKRESVKRATEKALRHNPIGEKSMLPEQTNYNRQLTKRPRMNSRRQYC